MTNIEFKEILVGKIIIKVKFTPNNSPKLSYGHLVNDETLDNNSTSVAIDSIHFSDGTYRILW